MATEIEDGVYDYIIVGSGAGGGPLAARLALAGKRVLVIEAGADHGSLPPLAPANEVSRCPVLHGVSTEHQDLSWRFFVDHYERRNGNLPDGIPEDPKWHKPHRVGDELQEGIFYPRSSSVGGCTIHNAMITIAGPDSDWDDLADLLGDDSWRAGAMRGYFRRLENNGYLPPPSKGKQSTFAFFYSYVRDSAMWLLGRKPDHARGQHGFEGWLHTSVADLSLGLRDKQLVRMLVAALWQAKLAGLDRAWTFVSRFFKGEISRSLDPNHRTTQRESPEGVVLIPVSVCGKGTTIHQNRQTPYAMLGRRSSPREFLYEAKANCGDKLTILTNCLVTKVILDDNTPPRAIGVKYLEGERLYKASVSPNQPTGDAKPLHVKPGGEIVLCGGTFNTPQLLMLSGIGDPAELSRQEIGVPCRVILPGVGKNLQDRYEVSVVGQMKHDFSLLDGADLKLPDDPNKPDPHLLQWRREGTGLYASNGGVLGIFMRSSPELPQPDLFIFGLPSDFRGYSVGYSEVKRHDLFTWVILKSHSRNRDGRVSLRSSSPLDPPKINFHYFNSASQSGQTATDGDVAAIAKGVDFARRIFKSAGKSVKQELHPGTTLVPKDDVDAMRKWIRSEAWGHHACGTCRMGRSDDPDAVLDSRFRVRHVDGLRVVDASIFPRIPGYFIVANIYMASEKAADVILADSNPATAHDAKSYPWELRKIEADALASRRGQLPTDDCTYRPEPVLLPTHDWSSDVTGLALSGGGIRSATLSLGILQNMARSSWLRRIDFLSTVSGGGYIGSCVGRMYDRLRPDQSTTAPIQSVNPATRVEEQLTNPNSPAVDWLRKHGNYIAPQGGGDGRLNLAVFVRNLLSIHLVVGLALFSLFGLANLIRYGFFEKGLAVVGLAVNRADLPIGNLIASWLGPFFSPWFILCELLLLFLVLPRITGYWIVSQDKHESFKRVPLLVLVLMASLLLYAGVSSGLRWEPLLIGLALLTSLIQVELAWWRGNVREEAVGSGNVETQRLRTRNYLTYDLGLGLALAGAALVFAIIDTLGHGLHQWKVVSNQSYARAFAAFGATIAAGIPIARMLAGMFTDNQSGPPSTLSRILKRDMVAGLLAVVLFTVPLVFYSFTAHAAFAGGNAVWAGFGATGLAILVTIFFALPSALAFVNRSSLAQTYSARLARAYLGASNPLRYRPEGQNVTEVLPGDDVASIRNYRPYMASGPLHLINLTINQTLDSGSRLRKRDRQGENMAVSCLAVSVGEKWHSAWAGDTAIGNTAASKVPSRLEPLGHTPGTEHPLVDVLGQPADRVEMMSLRQWIGISGAAVDPGRGRTTNLGIALLMGMVNLRTGHWWDSGMPEAARSGFPDLSFMRRVLYLIPRFFATQCLLIFEWIARYPGPWERFWHLSDGGFFENTGAYELVRRRVPRIIICDGSADPHYEMESFAEFVRKVRIDFGASVEPFDADDLKQHVPTGILNRVGSIDELKLKKTPDGRPATVAQKHAALFWVRYADLPERKSVLLYFKASLNGDESIDIQHYHATHPEFPHENTADQFFDEAQWESYRKLGDHLSEPVVAQGDWLWRIPLS